MPRFKKTHLTDHNSTDSRTTYCGRGIFRIDYNYIPYLSSTCNPFEADCKSCLRTAKSRHGTTDVDMLDYNSELFGVILTDYEDTVLKRKLAAQIELTVAENYPHNWPIGWCVEIAESE